MFSLDSARCTIRSVNLRTEQHGDESVPACDLKVALMRPATDLAMFGPLLRDSFFWRDPASAEPSLLDEIDPSLEKPNLRNPMLKGPFAVDVSYVGCHVTIDYGLGGDSDIEIDLAKVSQVKVTPLEGGSVVLSLRVQFLLDEETAGRLALLINHETAISITEAERGAIAAEREEEEVAA